jgi:hypothetical protein
MTAPLLTPLLADPLVPAYISAPVRVVQTARVIDQAGGLDFVLEKLHGGDTLSRLARTLRLSAGDIRRWANALPPAEQQQIQMAEESGASTLAEQTIDILDVAAERVEDHEDVKASDILNAAEKRANARRWYAERRHKEMWSPKATTEVNVSFGAIFIDALRRRTVPSAAASAALVEIQPPAQPETPPVAPMTLDDLL